MSWVYRIRSQKPSAILFESIEPVGKCTYILNIMMELSKDTIDGLNNILNTNNVNDDSFVQIVDTALSYIQENPAEIKCTVATSDSKSGFTKKLFADVVCLLIESARHDLDEESLKNFLHLEHVDENRIKKLCDVYINNKTAMQSQLEFIGNNLPHIIDVDWHLDYCVKLDTCNSMGIPLYHVQFSTKKHETINYVKFSCTIQQLQDLVFKLKDAIRYLERLTNV